MNVSIGKEELEDINITAMQAATLSSEILMKYWKEYPRQIQDLDVITKEDGTPATKVDYELEKVIRELIIQNHPTHKIIGEELSEENSEDSPFLWIIDPIDGTRQYIRGLRYFATQIAVFHDNRIIMGVSNAPALKETLSAFDGGGAYLNGKKVHVSRASHLQDCYISHGNIKYFNEKDKLKQLAELSANSWVNRGFGDFLGYHFLANGRIDVMLEAKTKIFDIAAVAIIIEEAGGKVTDLNGLPISLQSTSIIATNGFVHNEIVNFFKSGATVREN